MTAPTGPLASAPSLQTLTAVTIDLALTAKCVACGAERDGLIGTLLFEGKQAMVLQGRTACGCGERRFKVQIGADTDEASPSTKDVRRLAARRTG